MRYTDVQYQQCRLELPDLPEKLPPSISGLNKRLYSEFLDGTTARELGRSLAISHQAVLQRVHRVRDAIKTLQSAT